MKDPTLLSWGQRWTGLPHLTLAENVIRMHDPVCTSLGQRPGPLGDTGLGAMAAGGPGCPRAGGQSQIQWGGSFT